MANSLFTASAADLTIERIRAFAARPDQVESLTLEFKREYSTSLVKTIAAMANTYGGTILVGINDKAEPGIERVVGVDAQATIDKIASTCSEKLDPPWEPTFITVPFDDDSGRSVVVIRVGPNVAPRPLLIDLKAPIRLSGQNSIADRGRLLQLAREEPAAGLLPMGQSVMAPRLNQDKDGKATEDFILRTGINLPMGEAGAWRPLSERSVIALAKALNDSAFPSALRTLGQGAFDQFMGFRPYGHNRSRTARLVFQAISRAPVPNPVEAVVTVNLPEVYGSASTALTANVIIDVIARVRRYADSIETGREYRYPVPNLADLLDGLLRTLVAPEVVTEIARIADIDTALVAQPRELHLIADRQVKDLLNPAGLKEIPDAGASAGGIFRANPALDLRDIAERQEQVDDWLRQLGLDAGLTGMEALVEDYRAKTPTMA
ncbi:ATP-binding protein [Streptomyces sp. WAC 00631]|uniref:AlbA family DNA-binding domain-containing protein n=1 Tax=Streptomyces sp. WAC 00631 TaxID=2203201 RepID=UPI00163D1243|nr:ATP-binding protein [Streptomyces sp. WAC 00631]MCC5032446.1 ATP-binding protein [Streptomyces sp. WAC 00631]